MTNPNAAAALAQADFWDRMAADSRRIVAQGDATYAAQAELEEARANAYRALAATWK